MERTGKAANGIKAILFDFDGTIRYSRPGGMETFHRFVEELGFLLTPEARRQCARWEHYYWAESDELKQDLVRFPRTEDDSAFWKNYHHKLLIASGLPEETALHVESLFLRMQAEHQPVDHVPEQVPLMLAALRQEGYIVGLVSNRPEPLGPLLAALGLEGAFDFTLAAGEIGVWKPAPEIFLHAARLAGVEPDEAVYVGDNYFADALGATQAGMGAILLDPQKLFPEAVCHVISEVWDVPDLLTRLIQQAHEQVLPLVPDRLP